MRYRKHGTTLVAVMLAAIMMLSVFAMPVAATPEPGDTDEATTVVSADDFDQGTTDVEKTENVNATFGGDANTGDQVIIEIDDSNFGDGEILIKEVGIDENPDGENDEITDGEDVSISSFNGGVFASSNDDSIAVTLEDEDLDDTDISGDTVEIEVTYEIDSSLHDEPNDALDTVFDVVTDETDGDLTDQVLVELDIEPGEPDQLVTDVSDDEITFDDGSTTVDVTLQDQSSNDIENNKFVERTDVSALSAGEVQFDAALLDNSSNTVDEVTEEDSVTIDLSDGTDETTFTINADNEDSEEINDVVVGDALEIEASDDGLTDDADDFGVVPDAIEIISDTQSVQNADESGDDKVIADDGVADVEVTLLDGESGDRIGDADIDEIQIAFSSLDTAALSADSVDFISQDFIFNNDQVVIEANLDDEADNELEFNETDNSFDEAVTVDVDPRDAVSSSEDDDTDINVISGDPTTVGFADSLINAPIQVSGSLDGESVTVEVRDDQGNVIDDRKFGDTTVDLSTGQDDTDDVEVTVTTGQSAGGNEDVDLRAPSIASTSDLGVAAGETTLNLDQIKQGSLGENLVDDEDVELNVFPQINIEDGPAGSNAGAHSDDIDVILEYEDSNEEISDNDIDEVDVEYTFFNDTNLQAGVDEEDIEAEFNLQGQDAEDAPVTITHDDSATDVTVEYNSTTAGEFKIGVDAIPAIDEGDDTAETEDFVVHASSIYDDNSEIRTVDHDFLGTIVDEDAEDDDHTTSTIEFDLRDEFDNIVAYGDNPNFDDGNVKVDVAGENIEDKGDFDTIIVESLDSGVQDANDSVEYDFTPTELPDETDTGENAGDITLEDVETSATVTEDGDEAFDLVHEAFNMDEDLQRFSLPQAAEIYEDGLNYATTWNATDNTYNEDDLDLSGVVDGEAELHGGLYVNGEDDEARLGFDYVEEEVNPGEVHLEDGWNFVGTNFQISAEDNTPLGLDTDLLTVDSIEKSGSGDEAVLDGALGLTLSADEDNSESDTGDLVDIISVNDNDQGEYGTYWVYIEDTSEFDNSRQIVGSEYVPGERQSAIDEYIDE